jgi:Tfp pilus assembly protein PilX
MNTRKPTPNPPRQGTGRRTMSRGQKGAVLIVGLVILLVVTMIGVGGQQSTVLQERMAGNMRQNNIAFQAAEAALQAALSYIESQGLPIPATDSGTDLVWTSCTVARASGAAATEEEGGTVANDHACKRFENTILKDWAQDAADISAGKTYGDVVEALTGTTSSIPDVAAQPRIYIEVRDEPISYDYEDTLKGKFVVYYYTVTAIGFGENEQARAILQSTIAKQSFQ